MKKVAIRSDRSDLDPIERLFREEGARMWRALVAFTGGRKEIADDAVAEAFAQAIRYAPSIRDP
jgi:DNA-directed RNA polymerase specialized sigma24 family protein